MNEGEVSGIHRMVCAAGMPKKLRFWPPFGRVSDQQHQQQQQQQQVQQQKKQRRQESLHKLPIALFHAGILL